MDLCFVLFLVCCVSANANVYFKTTFKGSCVRGPLRPGGSAVRFGQALPGFLITAHHLYASLL